MAVRVDPSCGSIPSAYDMSLYVSASPVAYGIVFVIIAPCNSKSKASSVPSDAVPHSSVDMNCEEVVGHRLTKAPVPKSRGVSSGAELSRSMLGGTKAYEA